MSRVCADHCATGRNTGHAGGLGFKAERWRETTPPDLNSKLKRAVRPRRPNLGVNPHHRAGERAAAARLGPRPGLPSSPSCSCTFPKSDPPTTPTGIFCRSRWTKSSISLEIFCAEQGNSGEPQGGAGGRLWQHPVPRLCDAVAQAARPSRPRGAVQLRTGWRQLHRTPPPMVRLVSVLRDGGYQCCVLVFVSLPSPAQLWFTEALCAPVCLSVCVCVLPVRSSCLRSKPLLFLRWVPANLATTVPCTGLLRERTHP